MDVKPRLCFAAVLLWAAISQGAHACDQRIAESFTLFQGNGPEMAAGPDITSQFTKDGNGHGIECPAGFESAAVVCRAEAGNQLTIPPGGFFVTFD